MYFSTVFLNCISQPYFSTVFLNCIFQLYFSTHIPVMQDRQLPPPLFAPMYQPPSPSAADPSITLHWCSVCATVWRCAMWTDVYSYSSFVEQDLYVWADWCNQAWPPAFIRQMSPDSPTHISPPIPYSSSSPSRCDRPSLIDWTWPSPCPIVMV